MKKKMRMRKSCSLVKISMGYKVTPLDLDDEGYRTFHKERSLTSRTMKKRKNIENIQILNRNKYSKKYSIDVIDVKSSI